MDVIGVRGSGVTPARVSLLRRDRSDTDYLAGKKLIIRLVYIDVVST